MRYITSYPDRSVQSWPAFPLAIAEDRSNPQFCSADGSEGVYGSVSINSDLGEW